MELKKSVKADLENKKGLFLEIGLVVSIAICLVAFNVKNYETKEFVDTIEHVSEMDELDAIQTEQEQEPEPEVEQQLEELVTTEFEEVEDDKVIENEFHIDANTNSDEEITYAPVEVLEEVAEIEDEVYVFVEEQPSFPGGEEELYKYLRSNIQYPELARANNVEGKVFVQFVVEKDGRITNVKVLKDIGSGCGAEAMRVVKSMPKWKPGKQRNQAVRAQFSLPISFKLGA